MKSSRDDDHRITRLLDRLKLGDRSAQSELLPLVYDQLLNIARHQFSAERSGHTLQPSALISELYLRVVRDPSIDWQSRSHFFAIAAETIRRILVDHARARNAQRRPNPRNRVSIDDVLVHSDDRALEVLAIDEALTRLAERDRRMAKVVELRVFGGLSVEETAEALGISARTVKRDWTVARAWLSKLLAADAR